MFTDQIFCSFVVDGKKKKKEKKAEKENEPTAFKRIANKSKEEKKKKPVKLRVTCDIVLVNAY